MKKAVVLLLIILTMLFTFGACGETQGPKTIRISFDTDGKVYVASMKVVLGEVPQIPETPQVEGYVFAGWYFDEELTNRYFFDYALEESATLYAKFYDLTLGEYTVISNVEQLIAIKDAPDAKYLLACDINCKGETLEPIETFIGELDGNGYKILNFAISKDRSHVAFIVNNQGTIKNLSFGDFVFDVKVTVGMESIIALICGKNMGAVKNCHVLDSALKIAVTASQSIGASSAYAGVVGQNLGILEGCTNNAEIFVQVSSGQLTYSIAGVVGDNNSNGTVVNCVNAGMIKVSVGLSWGYQGAIVAVWLVHRTI